MALKSKKSVCRVSGKLLTAIILVSVIAILLIFDIIRASTFSLKVISADPEPVVADGKSSCTLIVELNDAYGNPVEGHNIYAFITDGGGNFTQQRNTTDESGQIELSFKPLRATKYSPATDVTVKIYDESNSIFFLIPKTIYYVIKVVDEA